jgi:curved DNA-binding protein CbpA
MAVRMNLNKDYYAELGVALNGRSPADIPKAEIQEAVKGLENLSPEQQAGRIRRIEAIKEASAVLLDDKERAKYNSLKRFDTSAAANLHSADDVPKVQNAATGPKPKANHYEVLGVDEKASPKEIKEAFDKTQNTVRKGESIAAASRRLTAEQEAFQVLGNQKSREGYDKRLEASRPAPRGYFKVIGVSEDASPKEIESKINEMKENAKSTGGKLTDAQNKAIEVMENSDKREKYINNLKGSSTALGTNYKGGAAELVKDSLLDSNKNINTPDKVSVPDKVGDKGIEIPKVRGKMGFFIAGAKFIGSLIVTDIALNKASEYLFGDANASNKPSVPIANPPIEHKVEPVPEQSEHKAFRESKQTEKAKMQAAEIGKQDGKNAKSDMVAAAPDGTGVAKSADTAKDNTKGEDSVREVQKGDTLTSIADSRDADMKKARAQVREALGGNADNTTVLNVLAIALAENNGKEKINRIEVGDKLSISGDKIKQVVADLKEAGKLENGRLALGNETTLTEIFARAPNTPSNNPQVASAGK